MKYKIFYVTIIVLLKAVCLISAMVTMLLASANSLLAQNVYCNVSGHVRTSSGDPIADVQMRTGGWTATTTKADGYYELTGNCTFSMDVSPYKDGWTFEPPVRLYAGGGGPYTNQDFVGTYSGGSQSTIITFDEERYRKIKGQRLYHGGPNTLFDYEASLDYYVAYGEMYIKEYNGDYMMYFTPHGASGYDPCGRIVITFNQLKKYVRIKVTSDFIPIHTPAYLRTSFYKNITPTNPLYFKDGGGDVEHTDTVTGIKMLIVETHFAENNIEELEFISFGTPTTPAPSGVTALGNYDSAVPLAWRAPNGGLLSMSSSTVGLEMSDKTIEIGKRAKVDATSATLQGYNIYRSISASGTYSRIASNISRQYYRDESVMNGQTYYYKVTAVYDVGESNYSDAISAYVQANGSKINSNWTSSPPTLDGVINTNEWAPAVKTDITYPGYNGAVTLYTMNNANKLYFAVNNSRDHLLEDDDTFGIFFDDDHNHEWPSSSPSGEGLFQLFWDNASSSALNKYWDFYGWWPDKLHTKNWINAAGVNQGISISSGNIQFEGSIDLKTSDLKATPGNTIGMLLYAWNNGVADFDGAWPQETAAKLPAIVTGFGWCWASFTYGDVKLASGPTSQPDIAGTPSTWNYGAVNVGSSSDKTFVIKNEGTANLNVTGTTLTGNNAAEFSIQSGGGAFTLAPAGTRDIMVRFSPTNAGSRSANLSINSNDPDENPFLVALSGTGTAIESIPITPVTASPQMAGIEFWVSIDVGKNTNPVTDLFGVSFVLNYSNTNYINYVSSEAGSFIGSGALFYPTPDDANGKVSIGISRMAPQTGVNGFGTVARVKLIADPATPNNTPVQLSISNVTANNSTGAPIVLAPGSLNITIIAGLIVWPGDTNNNGIVDQADVLPLGLHWGKTGPARQNASVAWSGQLAIFWNPQAATYADANGDGTVNQADVLPIGLNWNKTHTNGLMAAELSLVSLSTGLTAAKLTIVVNGSTQPDQNFCIDIYGNEVSNLFGLSFEMIYTPASIIDPQVAEAGPNNLLGSDVIYFPLINKTAGADTGKVSIGISRKSGQGGVSGSGLVTRITAHMSATVVNHFSTTHLTLTQILANDPSGNSIPIESTAYNLITDIQNDSKIEPIGFALYDNYPNPFNPETTIEFSLPQAGHVELQVFNMLGQQITTLISNELPAGNHTIRWDGEDAAGNQVAGGMYLYVLKAGQFTAQKKMILMK